jgi:hypothetical protein
MPTWKSIVFKAAGFGAGFALALCALVAGWFWHSSRPTPWNKSAVRATFTGLQYQARQDAFIMEFRYSVENLTNKDCIISPDRVVLRRMSGDAGYASDLDAELIGDLFIPAKQKMNIPIRVPYKYEDFNSSFSEQSDDKKTALFADRRLNRLDGFALFDKRNKYEIDFPNGWSQWESVKNAYK